MSCSVFTSPSTFLPVNLESACCADSSMALMPRRLPAHGVAAMTWSLRAPAPSPPPSHADDGGTKTPPHPVAAPVSDHLMQAEPEREQHHREIERPAHPAGVEEHAEIDLVHVFMMVAAREFERADAP